MAFGPLPLDLDVVTLDYSMHCGILSGAACRRPEESISASWLTGTMRCRWAQTGTQRQLWTTHFIKFMVGVGIAITAVGIVLYVLTIF